MYHRKFQQGDLVKYTGKKLGELAGKVGEICGRVAGTDSGVTVDFGEDQAYIMSENVLERTVAKPKFEGGEADNKKKQQPEVQKRRGVSKRQKGAENNAE